MPEEASLSQLVAKEELRDLVLLYSRAVDRKDVAYHAIPDGNGGYAEDFMCVRYIDRYRKEDGKWRFAARVVKYDYRTRRPIEAPDPLEDPSVAWLSHRLFARGGRA